MLEKVIENWTSRLDYIRASRGREERKTISLTNAEVYEKARLYAAAFRKFGIKKGDVVTYLNCLQENRLKVNSEREQDSPVEMGASNISRFKEMPFLKAKRHRAHAVVSGVRVKASKPKKNDPALRDYKRSTSSLESLIGH
ncbi:hypothetical protein TNCV_696371 [Trichonephila clavipes]|nr:hypothetical protein TNCV_696371 [Trichonephila clavipes]